MKNFTKMLLVSLMIIAALGSTPQARSQTLLLTESFENNGIIPAGWGSAIVTGSDKGMAFVTSQITGYPADEVFPFDGSYEVFYNSYNIITGSTRLFRTVGTSTVGYPGVSVDFAMYHDLGYAGMPEEGITTQYSIDGGNTWITAGSLIPRYDGSSGWKIHTLAFPANAGGQPNLRIAFLFTSQNGNNCFMDFAHLYGFTTSILQGTVTDCSSGTPLSGAMVSCGGQNVTTGEGGTYTISGIAPGNYTATCSFSPPYYPATAPVTINENQMTGQNFCLSPGAPLYISAGADQLVYYGYPPAACTTLSWSGESGGTQPYSIQWNTGETNQSITVCPTSTTVYTVTITDANNNTFTDDVKVCVIDVRCGSKLKKVQVCHHGHDQCVARSAVPALLRQGALLGSCGAQQNSCISTAVAPLHINAGANQLVYYGYPPAACATLRWSGASGGTPPYAIQWSTGEMTRSITVCPTSATVYTVTITDANNSTFSDDVKVCVNDVRCGHKLDKVQVCYHGHEQCVAKTSVACLLKQGALLGYCGADRTCSDLKSGNINSEENTDVTNDGTITLDAFPNPFSANATIAFTCPEDGSVTAKLIDHYGKETAVLFDDKVEKEVLYSVEIDGSKLTPGLYFCVLQHSDGTMKIRKLLFTK
jgi:hypothetical protein